MEFLKGGVEFQEVVESFPLPEDVHPKGFKFATKTFKPYFIGKVLSSASSQFKHRELVGGSLIASSRKDGEDQVHPPRHIFEKIIAFLNLFDLSMI